MRKSVLGAAIAALFGGASASAAPVTTPPVPREITDAVMSVFTAAANGDQAGFQRSVEPGFVVYENGGTMTADQVYAMARSVFDHGGRIEWSVTKPLGRVDGDLAAIQYINRGAVTRNGVRHPVTWLETAALHRVDGHWRIMFMQSQRSKETEMAGKQ